MHFELNQDKTATVVYISLKIVDVILTYVFVMRLKLKSEERRAGNVLIFTLRRLSMQG